MQGPQSSPDRDYRSFRIGDPPVIDGIDSGQSLGDEPASFSSRPPSGDVRDRSEPLGPAQSTHFLLEIGTAVGRRPFEEWSTGRPETRNVNPPKSLRHCSSMS